MSASQVFLIVNTMALVMWLLMIVLPKWKVTRFLIDFRLVPVVLALFYAIYIILSISNGPSMDFGSLEAVMQLFTFENAALAGWLHYLVFDLLVGMWMLDQNKTLKIHPVIMALCLIGTFLIGPIGFLIFTIVRTNKKQNTLNVN